MRTQTVRVAAYLGSKPYVAENVPHPEALAAFEKRLAVDGVPLDCEIANRMRWELDNMLTLMRMSTWGKVLTVEAAEHEIEMVLRRQGLGA